MRRRRSSRTATAMIVAVVGAVLMSVDPRAGAEPVDLELVNPAGVRAAPWRWATPDATWFGPRSPAPGEWYWPGERRALACASDDSATASRPADGDVFTPVLGGGVGTTPDGACGGGDGGDGGGTTLLALASCTTPPNWAISTGLPMGGAANFGFSSAPRGSRSAPAPRVGVQYSGARADALSNADEGAVAAPLVVAETNVPAAVTTPLPTAALSGLTVLGGVGLFGRRRPPK